MNIVVENIPFNKNYDDNVNLTIYMSCLHAYELFEWEIASISTEIDDVVPYLDSLQREWLVGLNRKDLFLNINEHVSISFLKDELEKHLKKELKADKLFCKEHNLPF